MLILQCEVVLSILVVPCSITITGYNLLLQKDNKSFFALFLIYLNSEAARYKDLLFLFYRGAENGVVFIDLISAVYSHFTHVPLDAYPSHHYTVKCRSSRF
jgi:hypothetical protein